jgi:hypothetical protein
MQYAAVEQEFQERYNKAWTDPSQPPSKQVIISQMIAELRAKGKPGLRLGVDIARMITAGDLPNRPITEYRK